MARVKEPKQQEADGWYIERYTGARKHYWSIYRIVGGRHLLAANSAHFDTRDEADEAWFDFQQAVVDGRLPEDNNFTSSWTRTLYDESKFNKSGGHFFIVFGTSAGKYKLILQSARFLHIDNMNELWVAFRQMVIDADFTDKDNQ